MSETKTFYSVGERDRITAESVDEAVEEYIEDMYGISNEGGDLEHYMRLKGSVEVQEYERLTISPDCDCFEWSLENLLDNLHENYGDPEDQYYPTSFSEKAKAKYNQFKHQVIKDYPVCRLRAIGEPITVNLNSYLES